MFCDWILHVRKEFTCVVYKLKYPLQELMKCEEHILFHRKILKKPKLRCSGPSKDTGILSSYLPLDLKKNQVL